MITMAKGKYTKVNFNSPEAIARCDYSGMMVRHKDMIKQMEYNATGLYWTGWMVNPKFADKPQPQHLMPLVKIDPEPVYMARPGSTTVTPQIEFSQINVAGAANVSLTIDQFNYLNLEFVGELTGNVVVLVPPVFNEFYATNSTTGAFTLSMQVDTNSSTNIILPRDQVPLICNDGFVLTIIYPN